MTMKRLTKQEDLGRPFDEIAEIRFINKNDLAETWMVRWSPNEGERASGIKVLLAWTETIEEANDTEVHEKVALLEKAVEQFEQHLEVHHQQINGDYETRKESWVCNWRPDGPRTA